MQVKHRVHIQPPLCIYRPNVIKLHVLSPLTRKTPDPPAVPDLQIVSPHADTLHVHLRVYAGI